MPEINRPLKVFLSYASQDRPLVRELSRRLVGEGWIDTWQDEKNLLPGQDWRVKIEEAVEEADVVIIVLSQHSVSKEGHVQKELRYAREIALEKPEDAIFLIPLRLDECEVPRGLRFYQWVDYFGERKNEGYDSLVESLQLRYEQKLKQEEEASTRQEKIRKEHEAAEKIVREKAEKVAAEKARLEAKELAKQKAAKEKAAREKAEKKAAEKVWFEKTWAEAEEREKQKAAQDKKEREAAEKTARERAMRESAEKAKREASKEEKSTRKLDKFEAQKSEPQNRQSNSGAQPLYWVFGLVGVVLLIWLSSLNGPPSVQENTRITMTPYLTYPATQTAFAVVLPKNTSVSSSTPTKVIINTQSVPSSTPTKTVTDTQSVSSNYVNLFIDEVKIIGNVGDQGKIRLILLGSDVMGKSDGMFCPSGSSLEISKGDTVQSPCLLSFSFNEAEVADGVYLSVMVLDEIKSPLPAYLSYETVSNELGTALGEAVTKGAVKVEAINESNPYTFSVDTLANLVTGELKTWLEKAVFVGVQGIYLSRQDNWSEDNTITVTSTDGGIQITYTVIGSTTSVP